MRSSTEEIKPCVGESTHFLYGLRLRIHGPRGRLKGFEDLEQLAGFRHDFLDGFLSDSTHDRNIELGAVLLLIVVLRKGDQC